MAARKAAVAGQFYGGTRDQCLSEVKECLLEGKIEVALPEKIAAAIVPHAGWVFSGALAAMAFSAIKQAGGDVDSFVIFGAVHQRMGRQPAVYDRGCWSTPLGEIAIDEDLAARIVATGCAEANTDAHRDEHSIEVQVPFIQFLFPEAKIVPVMVPPATSAAKLGEEVGKIIADMPEKRIVCIASTDLTHYGPRYGFYPSGTGGAALKWAKEVNDAEFIDLAVALEAEKMVENALEKTNACGPGAVAAAVSAARTLGKDKGVLLAHTDSNEIMERKFGRSSEESVGYAGIVF